MIPYLVTLKRKIQAQLSMVGLNDALMSLMVEEGGAVTSAHH